MSIRPARHLFVAFSVLVSVALSVHSARAAGALSPQWSRRDGTASIDDATGVALDVSGDIFVVGWTNGTFAGATSAGSSDGFLARYSPSGILRWVKQFGTSAADLPTGVALDTSGNVYVVGHTYGNFDGSTPQINGDVFLLKFANTGTELWRRQLGSAQREQAGGVAVDRTGDVLIVGSTEGVMPGGASQGETDVFVARYTAAGTRTWITQFGTSNEDFGYGIAVDIWGTIAVVGETQGQFPGQRETGITDAYVATFAADGKTRWIRQENSGPDFAYNRFMAVAMDDNENIIVGGSTGGSYNADTVVRGESDAVVVVYNRYASRLWVRQFGSAAKDSVLAITRAPNGDIYASGDTQGRFYGYAGATGSGDAFVVGFDSAGTTKWGAQFGTANPDQLVSIDSASDGTVVAAGFTNGALTPGLVTQDEDAVTMKWSAFDAMIPVSKTIKVGRTISKVGLLSLVGLTTPTGSTLALTIGVSSRTKCSVVGSTVKGRSRGTCKVTVSVTTRAGIKRTATVELVVR